MGRGRGLWIADLSVATPELRPASAEDSQEDMEVVEPPPNCDYICDGNCGFEGSYVAVEAHEKSCAVLDADNENDDGDNDQGSGGCSKIQL